jgi:quinol monooxygenase YgiN
VSVERDEPGTRRYCWYFNDPETECYVTEEYEDSKAGISHLKGAAIVVFLTQLLKISKVNRFEVFGNPNKELQDMLEAFGPKFFRVFTGFAR